MRFNQRERPGSSPTVKDATIGTHFRVSRPSLERACWAATGSDEMRCNAANISLPDGQGLPMTEEVRLSRRAPLQECPVTTDRPVHFRKRHLTCGFENLISATEQPGQREMPSIHSLMPPAVKSPATLIGWPDTCVLWPPSIQPYPPIAPLPARRPYTYLMRGL